MTVHTTAPFLPQPSLTADQLRAALGSHILTDGGPPGIIATDPLTVQCANCGTTASQTGERRWQVFLITCGYGFHTCTRGSEGRLCRTCLAETTRSCDLGRCRR